VAARFSVPVQTGPGAHPASCTMGTASFPGVKSGRGETLTPHPLLVPWSRKSRAIPLLPLWAVRPVQTLSACTRVHFTFYFICHQQPRVPNTAISSDYPTKVINTSLISPVLYTTFALHLSINTSEIHPHCEYNDDQLTANSRSGTCVQNSHCTPLRHSNAADYTLNAFKT